jgi:hypothetical protein
MTNKSSIAFVSKRRRFSIFSFLKQRTFIWGCSGAIAVQLLLHSPKLALACGGAIAFSRLLFQEIQASVQSMSRWGISLKLVFITFLIIWNLTPTGGGTANASLIKLVFNVLRALYLLYLGISLVRVVYSVRQDEDWQAIARTPLLILLTVSVADILTTTIVGT